MSSFTDKMDQVTDKKHPEKFLFNLNIFDEDVEEIVEEENLPPPPPTFSEEELEAARREGYERGKKDAAAAAASSREQFIAAQMEVIARALPDLFAAEESREKRYEEEALKLAALSLRKLFPVMNDRHGFDEVINVIRETLQTAEGKAKVIIEVTPEATEGVRNHLSALTASMTGVDMDICPAQDIPAGSCRMRWEDGGAVRDASALASAIEKQIVTLLRARGSGLPAAENVIEQKEAAVSKRPDTDSNDGEENE